MKSLPLFVLALGIALTASAQPRAAILPFEPAQILATLPAAPKDWSVTRSEAETTLADWLETRATRVFRSPQLTRNSQVTSMPAAPAEIEISVTDTAAFTPALASFTGFTPGKSGNVEKKRIGTLPAIIFSAEDGRQLAQILVSGRYIIELSASGQSLSFHVEDWLRKFHFDTLPPQQTALTSRPREFHLSHIDELHPENNRSYSVETTGPTRVSTFLKNLPASSDDR